MICVSIYGYSNFVGYQYHMINGLIESYDHGLGLLRFMLMSNTRTEQYGMYESATFMRCSHVCELYPQNCTYYEIKE